MGEVIKFLSDNPIIVYVLLFLLVVVTLVIIFQKRDITIGPVSIGKKQDSESAKTYDTEISGEDKPTDTQRLSFFIRREQLTTKRPFIDIINHSNDLLLGGVALGRTAQGYRSQLLRRLDQGTRLRFLVLDPNSPDIDYIAQVFEINPMQIRNDIGVTLGDLDKLQYLAKSTKGSIEVRLLIREPAFSFVISNPKGPNAYFSAGLRAYGLRSTERPYFVLKPPDPWFDEFVTICEDLWEKSSPRPRYIDTYKPIVQRAGVVVHRTGANGGIEVLLITGRRENQQKWIFPVGMVDPGENLIQTAARECSEESGYRVKVGSRLGVLEFDEGKSINQMTFFLAQKEDEIQYFETDRQRKWVPLLELVNSVAEDFRIIARSAVAKLDRE